MGRLLALGILGTLACAAVAPAFAAEGRRGELQNGTVSGTITTTAKGAPPVRVTIDQKVCGQELPDEAIVVDAQGRLANAVVFLTGLKRPAQAEATVTNDKCRFTPRVQLIAAKTTVHTTSHDPILHTTHAQLENGRTLFNLAVPVPGITLNRVITPGGNVRLICNTHPWMRGWMIVTDEAAAISGGDGRFSIGNVPPGTYELRVWHETLKGAPQKITVAAGKPTEVQLQLK